MIIKLQVINDDGSVRMEAQFPITNIYEWRADNRHEVLINHDGSGIASFRYVPEVVYNDENHLQLPVLDDQGRLYS